MLRNYDNDNDNDNSSRFKRARTTTDFVEDVQTLILGTQANQINEMLNNSVESTKMIKSKSDSVSSKIVELKQEIPALNELLKKTSALSEKKSTIKIGEATQQNDTEIKSTQKNYDESLDKYRTFLASFTNELQVSVEDDNPFTMQLENNEGDEFEYGDEDNSEVESDNLEDAILSKNTPETNLGLETKNPPTTDLSELSKEMNHMEIMQTLMQMRKAFKEVEKQLYMKYSKSFNVLKHSLDADMDNGLRKNVSKLLLEEFKSYPESLQKEFKTRGIDKSEWAIIDLKKLSVLYGYDKKDLTPEFLKETEKTVRKDLEKDVSTFKDTDKKLKELEKSLSDSKSLVILSPNQKELELESSMMLAMISKEIKSNMSELIQDIQIKNEKLACINEINNEILRKNNPSLSMMYI